MELNTKNHIYRALAELLLWHDCIIIPGLGGFVATRKPAAIMPNGIIVPPSKALSFNSLLQNNDGIFIHHIASKLSLSYVESETVVQEWVDEINRLLKENQVIHLPSVGKLKRNSDEKIIFTQSADNNLLLSSFGLKPVALPAQKPQTVNEEIVAQLLDESIPRAMAAQTPHQNQKTSGKIALYVSAICIIGVLILSQLLLFNAKRAQISLQNLDLTDVKAVFMPPPAAWPADTRKITLPPVKSKANTAPSIQPRLKEQVTPVQHDELPKGYYIIIGSFKDFNNAYKNLMRFKNKGMQAHIIPSENNFYRVGIYVSGQSYEASEKVREFRKQYQKNAWVMQNT
jgi:cell division septation protein DedD